MIDEKVMSSSLGGELKSWKDPLTGDRHFHVRLTSLDMGIMRLYPWDRKLLDEIENDKAATVADKILGLELVVRRIEESREKEQNTPSKGLWGER